MNRHVIDVPQLVRAEKQERVGERQMQRRTLYTPPLDGSFDVHRDFDEWVAGRVYEILESKYPGWGWDCKCRAEQGLVYFNIPALMGDTLNATIKLAQWEDMVQRGEHLVKELGGQLLERMGLPRGRFDAAAFMRARNNKHLLDFADVGRSKSQYIAGAPRLIKAG